MTENNSKSTVIKNGLCTVTVKKKHFLTILFFNVDVSRFLSMCETFGSLTAEGK